MRHIQYSKNDTYAKHNSVKDGFSRMNLTVAYISNI